MPRLTARDKTLLDRDMFHAPARPHPLEYDWKQQLAESNRIWHRDRALQMYVPMDFAKVMGLAHYAATMERLLKDILNNEIRDARENVGNWYIIPRSIVLEIQELFNQFKTEEVITHGMDQG